jgi:hypothetical protein
MGSNFANELSTMSDISLEDAIGMHLRGNHYPPVPLSMVQPCIDAIDAYWECDNDRDIELPEGVTYRDGATSAPAWAIIENHHLDAWCTEDYEE